MSFQSPDEVRKLMLEALKLKKAKIKTATQKFIEFKLKLDLFTDVTFRSSFLEIPQGTIIELGTSGLSREKSIDEAFFDWDEYAISLEKVKNSVMDIKSIINALDEDDIEFGRITLPEVEVRLAAKCPECGASSKGAFRCSYCGAVLVSEVKRIERKLKKRT